MAQSPEWKVPAQQRSRERFQRILDVAGQLLDNGGVANLTMEKVAAGADTYLFGGTGNCAKGNTIGLIGFDLLPPEC